MRERSPALPTEREIAALAEECAADFDAIEAELARMEVSAAPRPGCEVCGASLAGMRSDAIVCGPTCRQRARRSRVV